MIWVGRWRAKLVRGPDGGFHMKTIPIVAICAAEIAEVKSASTRISCLDIPMFQTDSRQS